MTTLYKKEIMAVNVDTVYQRVLSILNKEQRGYLTPQEFNLLANQAQLDIFEQYFYDLNQFMRIPGNDTTYADQVDIIQEKIDAFEKFRQDVSMTSGGVGALPTNYRMGELSYNNGGTYVEVEKVSQNDLNHYINSPLLEPRVARPIYVQTSATAIQVYPTTITSGVTCNLISAPATIEWAYTNVNNHPLYNANNSTNFELHPSEEKNLVIKILALAGVLVKDPNVYQVAATEENKDVQQEKS